MKLFPLKMLFQIESNEEKSLVKSKKYILSSTGAYQCLNIMFMPMGCFSIKKEN